MYFVGEESDADVNTAQVTIMIDFPTDMCWGMSMPKFNAVVWASHIRPISLFWGSLVFP